MDFRYWDETELKNALEIQKRKKTEKFKKNSKINKNEKKRFSKNVCIENALNLLKTAFKVAIQLPKIDPH